MTLWAAYRPSTSWHRPVRPLYFSLAQFRGCLHISRSQFYEYKKRYQEQGLEGLKDLPPIHKSHPQTTAPEVVEQIMEWAYKQPTWGCEKISIKLRQAGTRLSAVTVQDILNRHELGSRQQRLFAAEKRHLAGEIELDETVIAALEHHNPCYRERHIESSRPGELLSVDTSKIGELPDGTKLTLHAAVDTYGSYAFGLLHSSKQPEASACYCTTMCCLSTSSTD